MVQGIDNREMIIRFISKMGFVFGDRAVAVIEQSNLPKEIKEILRNAKKYAEGRGLSIEVESPEQIGIIRKLVGIKIQN